MFIIFFLSIFCQLLSPRFQSRIGRVRPDHESSDQPAEKAALSNVVSLSIPLTFLNVVKFIDGMMMRLSNFEMFSQIVVASNKIK